MKRTIQAKTYNTDTAEELASAQSHAFRNDFSFWEESLYRTRRGAYFISGSGGPMSHYAESCGQNCWSGGSGIRPVTEAEALDWLEKNECEEAIGTHFAHLVVEA